MGDFVEKQIKKTIESQAWTPRWVQDDDGLHLLLAYEARFASKEVLSLVRSGLWDMGITCNTEADDRLVVGQLSIPEFEAQFPSIAAQGKSR